MREEVNALQKCAADIAAIEELFGEESPELWARYLQLKDDHKRLVSDVQHVLRESGRSGKVVVGEVTFTVVRTSKRKARLASLLAAAKEEGDIEALIEHGLLSYSADPKQFDRLPEYLRERYSDFLNTVPSTTRVSIPRHLK